MKNKPQGRRTQKVISLGLIYRKSAGTFGAASIFKSIFFYSFQNIFFPVHFHQEVHKCKDEYSRFVCCLHEIFIIREIWNFVTHQFFYHFMIIFQVTVLEMESVNVQRDNLFKAQLPLRLLKNMLVKL